MPALASLQAPLRRVLWITCAVLLVPALAMQVTPEVRWGPGDFLVAGALLFGTGTAMVVAARAAASRLQRAALVSLLAGVLLTVWAELAVGVVS